MGWGAPRIHSELLKLGIKISESSIAKYMVRQPKPPSPTWRTFLKNHAKQLVSVDFFIVPTALFQVLSLDKDSLDPRPVQSVGKIVAISEVGGLHHRYIRAEYVRTHFGNSPQLRLREIQL